MESNEFRERLPGDAKRDALYKYTSHVSVEKLYPADFYTYQLHLKAAASFIRHATLPIPSGSS